MRENDGRMRDGAATIDFHTHFMPRSASEVVLAGCPGLVIESETCGQMYRGEQHYRTIDERTWDAARRIGDMDERSVAMQVISPIPVCYSYDAAPADALAYARLHNDSMAEVVRTRPDRFAALAGVPLQDPDAACAELERAMRELGLHGVEIGTVAGGRELTDPALEPFWERCAALNAIVFIHPEMAPGFDRFTFLQMTISTFYPSETGMAAARLLMTGIFTRYPGLRIVLAHAGGTLPWLLPRLDRVWSIDAKIRAVLPQKPSAVARAFYGDTLTFDADNLALVVKRLGADRLVAGSDYPFAVMEVPPGAVIDDVPAFDDATRTALRYGNARRLLSR
jgi:aminocarboxymuconate-semialdehyde decarboxylase